jgi:hypothetical protein
MQQQHRIRIYQTVKLLIPLASRTEPLTHKTTLAVMSRSHLLSRQLRKKRFISNLTEPE